MIKRLVNWYEENLHTFYGDDNRGLVHGIYYYDDPNDFPIEVEWFATEEERDQANV